MLHVEEHKIYYCVVWSNHLLHVEEDKIYLKKTKQCKISAPTWNNEVNLLDETYFMPDIL